MSNGKILIIDDDEAIRTRLQDILQYEGFIVLTAENGLAGFQLAQQELPDLIICDILMPELNGFGVLLKLRQIPSTATVPFIFLTGQTTQHDMRSGMELGADDYLTKPVQINSLLSSIYARLEKQQALRKDTTQRLETLRMSLGYDFLHHEVRTFTTGILGVSQFLLHLGPENLPSPKEILDGQILIRDSAFHLQHLLDEYFLYSELKLLESEPDTKHEKIWEHDIAVCSTHTLIRKYAREKASQMNRRQDLHLALADVEMLISHQVLQKVVTELLENAFKFSAPGSPVTVTSRLQHDCFAITISDRGQGMSTDEIASIGPFRKFAEGSNDEEGIGLGLTIIRLLLQQHHGELHIESIPNLGTTARVVFHVDEKM